MARAAQQALRRFGVLHLDDAVGDLHQRRCEVPGLDASRREGIGEIFARAAEIEQEVDADIVEDQRRNADDGALALLVAVVGADQRRIDLVEDLHQHPRHGHQDKIAIDDVTELMRHHGTRLILAQEFEQAFGHHDAGVRAQQAVGEGRRIAVRDEADARRLEAVVGGHLVDELMHAGIARLHRVVVEEDELVEPAERDIREPRADQPDDEIDDDGEHDGNAEIDLAGRHHGGEDHADDHAEEKAEGDERCNDEAKHDDPPLPSPHLSMARDYSGRPGHPAQRIGGKLRFRRA